MENTPKVQRRVSLSLNRLSSGSKRRTDSPQNLRRTQRNLQSHQYPALAALESPRSPSLTNICSDGMFQTPPHRKFNWDDSVDYSPCTFDSSFSPSSVLSQTLAIDTAEVGWRWTDATPDSAYADSSFTSAGSSSTEAKTARTRGDTLRLRGALDQKRVEERRAKEIEFRKAEKFRADELLKQRCARLQLQLNEVANGHAGVEKENNNNQGSTAAPRTRRAAKGMPATSKIGGTTTKPRDLLVSTSSSTDSGYAGKSTHRSGTHLTTTASVAATKEATKVASPAAPQQLHSSFSDFFNDSASDGFLLAATQQLESKIAPTTQRSASSAAVPAAPGTPKMGASSAAATATPPSASANSSFKRTSLYMKFLEDDMADDWFDTIDEVVAQATQSKKPRTSFQRYKSMPATTTTMTATMTEAVAVTSPAPTNVSASTVAKATAAGGGGRGSGVRRTANSSSSGGNAAAKMKRHSSSHALSPIASSLQRSAPSIKYHQDICRTLIQDILRTQTEEPLERDSFDGALKEEEDDSCTILISSSDESDELASERSRCGPLYREELDGSLLILDSD